jgi:hypothetical protein
MHQDTGWHLSLADRYQEPVGNTYAFLFVITKPFLGYFCVEDIRQKCSGEIQEEDVLLAIYLTLIGLVLLGPR